MLSCRLQAMLVACEESLSSWNPVESLELIRHLAHIAE